jgi:gamma-D-glutamyl-L-lysine dipeptidyl-peptidase
LTNALFNCVLFTKIAEKTMSSALCNLSVVPLRAEPAHRSEMVSQMLFGEVMQIVEEQGDWLQIVCEFDGYTGWLHYKQCRPVSHAFIEKFKSFPSPSCYELLQIVQNESRHIVIPVVFGSTIPNLQNNVFYIDEDKYLFDGQSLVPNNVTRQFLCETALHYLNAPYMWGGRSPFGIDCSGLVQMVYKICGYRMPRDAAEQAKKGSIISFVSQAAPGDIAFFDNEEGLITHAGIVLHGQKVLHASGRVKVDNLDHEGIYDPELKKYTHKLRLIKSVI